MRKILMFAMTLIMASAIMAKDYHVAKTGNDTNSGTFESPLLTIQAAANLAQAGDIITVHEGIYRERITPPRGGESDTQRIIYQAAPGEKVEVNGSEVVKNWVKHSLSVSVWGSRMRNYVSNSPVTVENKKAIIYMSGCFDKDENLYNKTFNRFKPIKYSDFT
jgi:hypothetical protein